MQDSTMGLRDRKRLETRRRIAEAARVLALEHGIDHTTIESIAEHADVSPRTFFNYFDSKEDAVLGLVELDLTPETLSRHLDEVAGETAADAVVGLVFRVFGDSFGDQRLHHERKEMLVRFPQLMRRQVTHMTTVAEALQGAVHTVLERDANWGPEAATPEAGEMLLGMCMTAIRAVSRGNAETDTSPEAVRQQVVDLIRATASRIRATGQVASAS